MAITVNLGDIVAVLALVVSAYAVRTTSNFNKRQQSLIESQEQLNEMFLEKEKNAAENHKKADLRASFIKRGNGDYKLNVWNAGNASAQNVRIEFPGTDDGVVKSYEVKDKFPLIKLEPSQSVELAAAIYLETKSRHTIKLIWSDNFSEVNEKTLHLFVPGH